MASRLVELLAEVRQSVVSVASTEAEVESIERAARDLEVEVRAYQRGPLEEACRPAVREELLALAAALRQLTPALTAALRPLASASVDDAVAEAASRSHAPPQLLECSVALGACAALGTAMSLPARDRYQIAAAAQLVLQAGHELLKPFPPLVEMSSTAVGRMLVGDADVMRMANCYGPLLCVVGNTMASLQGLGDAEAAFASSTARPAVLMPFLHSVTRLLLTLPAETTCGMDMAMAMYSQIVMDITERPAWSKHAEQLAADVALRTAVVDALLTRSLPAAAAAAAATTAQPAMPVLSGWLLMIQDALYSGCLSSTRRERLLHGSSASTSSTVVSLAQALPTQRPADAAPLDFAGPWAAITQLAAWSTEAACELSLSSGSSGSNAAGGSRAAGSQARVGRRTGAAGSSDEAAASPWDCVPVEALPQLMKVLQSLADESHGPAAHPRGAEEWCVAAATQCKLMVFAVQPLRGLLQCAPPPHAYTSLLEAVAAGLRLQPLLAQLHPTFQGMATAAAREETLRLARDSASQLSQELLATFSGLSSLQVSGLHSSSAAIAAAERALHSRAARFVHWLAAGGSLPWAAEPSLRVDLLHKLHHTLAHIFMLSLPRHRTALGQDSAEVLALCATHIEAAQAAVAASVTAGSPAAYAPPAADWAAGCFAAAAAAAPGLVNPMLLDAIHTALVPLAQDARQRAELTASLVPLVKATLACKHLALPFACSGLLELTLECVAHRSGRATTRAADREHVTLLQGGCSLFLAELHAACSLSEEEAPPCAIPADLALQAAVAADALRQGSAPLQLPGAAVLPPAELAQRVQQLLPAVRQAVAVRQQCWELPEQQQAMRLERARAAAGRSCAYLRCANVAAPDGPDAGPGGGSKRCSACRAVWYCSAACQHADWRDGHKHVCPVLMEERQRRKEEQRAQRAAQQA